MLMLLFRAGELCPGNSKEKYSDMFVPRVALETCQALLTATGFSTQSKILNNCRVDVGESLETFMTTVQQLIR
jgi:hypothetical protein